MKRESTKLFAMAIMLPLLTIVQRHSGINILTVEFTSLAGTLLLIGSSICKCIENK